MVGVRAAGGLHGRGRHLALVAAGARAPAAAQTGRRECVTCPREAAPSACGRDSSGPVRAGYTLAMRKFLLLISLALSALLLAACGNKGPLVLPSPDTAQVVPADDVAPDPAVSADEAQDADADKAAGQDDPGTPDGSNR